jgi:glycosyltransferase involved in cell wall biosynthesis
VLISICIPAYNQIKFLPQLLDSVLIQEYGDYEVIVSDDSVTDEVYNLIESRYSEKLGDRLRYVRNNPSLGSPRNWNNAVKMAKGTVIKIMHHDEYFTDQNSLGRFAEVMAGCEQNTLLVSGGHTLFQNTGVTENYTLNNADYSRVLSRPEELLFANVFRTPASVCYHKTDLEFDENLKWLVDSEFYIRHIKTYNRVRYIPEPLVCSIAYAEHNVTNDCIGNEEVEMREYMYVFEKWPLSVYKLRRFYRHFKQLFKLHSLFRFRDLQAYRATGWLKWLFAAAMLKLKIEFAFYNLKSSRMSRSNAA